MSRRIREAELANPSNDAERMEASQRMKSMMLTDYYPRPNYGTSGKPITVLANQFEARFKGQGKTILHYDVEINPVVKVSNQKKPVGLLRQCWAHLKKELATPEAKAFYNAGAYDGRKNLFTPEPIAKGKSKAHEFIINLPDADPRPGVPVEEQGRKFKIQIKHVADIDLESIAQFCAGKRQSIHNPEAMLTAFMSVNVLLRSNLHERYTASGAQERRFFSMDDHVPISNGAVVAKGFAQSFRPAIGNPAVQLDTAYSAFVAPGPLIEVAKGLLGRNNGGFRGGRGGPRGGRGGGDRGGRGAGRGGFGGPPAQDDALQSLSQHDVQRLRKVLFGAKFKVTHRTPNKIMSFGGLSLKSAEELTFTKDDGSKQSIAAYFKQQYNITLRFPRLPCVATGKRTYIPMELVIIEPFQSLPPLKLTPDQTAEMIKVSAKPPADRRDAIMAWRKKLAWDTRPVVQAWGIEIRDQFTEVPARVLNPPQIAYAGGARGLVKPGGGAWNLRGKKFFKAGKPLMSWSVVSFDRFFDIPKMQAFISFLVGQMKAVGINVANERPPCIGPNNPAGAGVLTALQQAGKAAFDAGKGQGAPQLIVVIMPAREVALYEEIKRCAATKLNAPVPTQCLQAKKLSQDRGLDQYCANVSMKINAKLGGINVSIPLRELPGVTAKTMLIGADVGHPPQGNGAIRPSIAATVASTNGENNNFKPCVRLQEGKKEAITDMGAMATYHLKEFEKNTRALPDTIIMFRDGVSESQYAAIVDIECKAIIDAAAKFKKGYKPKLTFIICAKRHSMRFFAKNPTDNDRSGNLPAGLVVDQKVTHPYAFDFYLQAHAGLVGTARPTHLVCLRNDSNFKVDEVQRLANALSYNFQRATRSVSIVSLAYYADLICTATRSMVYENDGTEYESTDAGTGGGPGTVRSLPAEQFDPMAIMAKIEKGGLFNQVQWYM